MAQDFTATGFLYENNIPADIATVHLTGFLDIYHVISSTCFVDRDLCVHELEDDFIHFGSLQKLKQLFSSGK